MLLILCSMIVLTAYDRLSRSFVAFEHLTRTRVTAYNYYLSSDVDFTIYRTTFSWWRDHTIGGYVFCKRSHRIIRKCYAQKCFANLPQRIFRKVLRRELFRKPNLRLMLYDQELKWSGYNHGLVYEVRFSANISQRIVRKCYAKKCFANAT